MTEATIFPGDHAKFPPNEIAQLAADEIGEAFGAIVAACATRDPIVPPYQAVVAISIGMAAAVRRLGETLGQQGMAAQVESKVLWLVRQNWAVVDEDYDLAAWKGDLDQLIKLAAMGDIGRQAIADALLQAGLALKAPADSDSTGRPQ